MANHKSIYYIGDIARDLGLSQRALRYYEELGFIKPTRTEGGFRTYSQHDVDMLRVVIQFKELGMTLDEIRSFFIQDHKSLTSEALKQLRDTLTVRRSEIKSKLRAYENGIQQIDRVLEVLSACDNCENPTEAEQCDSCLRQHGKEKTSLIHPLLSHEQET